MEFGLLLEVRVSFVVHSYAFPQEAKGICILSLATVYYITSSPISPLTSYLLHNISCLSFLALSQTPLLHHIITNWSRQYVP